MSDLPTSIDFGDLGHIPHHEEIHTLLQRMIESDYLGAGSLINTLTNRPAAADSEGSFFFASDVGTLAFSDGTTWHEQLLASAANTFTEVINFEDDAFFGSGRPWADVMHSAFAGGAAGDGVTSDSAAFQAAADALAALPNPGGVIFCPTPGTSYLIDLAVTIGDHVTLAGSGLASKIVGGGQTTLFSCEGSTGVRMQDLTVDMNAAGNFRVILDADDCTDVRVERCRLINTGGVTGAGWTQHGVLARSTSRLWIEGNVLEGVQIKTGAHGGVGAAEARHIYVLNNVTTDAFNFAISCVVAGPTCIVEDVYIAGNHSLNAESGGIFFGQDGTTGSSGDTYRRLLVADNVIVGNTTQTVGYIQGDIVDNAEDWALVDNKIYGVTKVTNVPGIALAENDSVCTLTGLLVSGNFIKTTDLEGIRITSARVTGARIVNNVLRDCRGIRFSNAATLAADLCEGRIENNELDGQSVNLMRLYIEGYLTVSIRGNTIRRSVVGAGSAPLHLRTTAVGQVLDADVVLNRISDIDGHPILFVTTGTVNVRIYLNTFANYVGSALTGTPTSMYRFLNFGDDAPNMGMPRAQLTATSVWDPPSMASLGVAATTTINVTGAQVGDVVSASLDTIGANAVIISAHVQAAGVVRVSLFNATAAPVDVASGNLRVVVLRPA